MSLFNRTKESSVKRNLVNVLVVLAAALLIAPAAFAQTAQTPQQICDAAAAPEPATREYAAAEQVLDASLDYAAVFCTGAGAVYVDLFEDYAPITVNNFVFLAQQGYYNNTTFHRVIENFMAQGGDPTGTGTGGPGYQFEDEFIGFLNFDRSGWLAMANAGPGTNGSQFFITTTPTPHLDFRHTIFGEVLEGQENVVAIDLRDPAAATAPGEALNTIVIVTDPALVQTTYTAPAPAVAEDYEAAMEQLNNSIPAPLLVDSEFSGVFSSEQTLALLPGDQSDGSAAAFFGAHGHSQRVQHRVTNATCDLASAGFMAISYGLDRFASPEEAAAALAEGWYEQSYIDQGFAASAEEGTTAPMLTRTRTVCEVDAIDAVMFLQRGRAVAIVSATVPAGDDVPLALLLQQGVAQNTYEYLFAAQIRTELK
ncbi:MAG: peptidylprolyl isomerase [Anaerolineae bacterium]|nr:peptidylprolyl isomerase [Anaerolineae bacterium]